MAVKLVIIGAGGLVGARMTQHAVQMQEFHISSTEKAPLKQIVLFDLNHPKAISAECLADPRVSVQLGDLTDKATMEKLLAPGDCTHVATIHLAAILSGYAEDNFDLGKLSLALTEHDACLPIRLAPNQQTLPSPLPPPLSFTHSLAGMKVNLFGSLNVIECVRALKDQLGAPQKYVYVSTDYVTCFNEQNKTNPVNEESFRLSPVSYGCQKACVELLLCDYSRKGFIDGRVGRLSA